MIEINRVLLGKVGKIAYSGGYYINGIIHIRGPSSVYYACFLEENIIGLIDIPGLLLFFFF